MMCTIFAFILFFAEIIMSLMCKFEYKGSFYFYLDAVATASLVPEIPFLWDTIMGMFAMNSEEDSGGAGNVGKAGRASRVGTKAGRIVRIVRLVRMVRIVKLYKLKQGGNDLANLEQQIAAEPSKIGKKLTEMTTRRVICMVLAMLIILPFFDGGLDDQYNNYQVEGLEHLAHYPQNYNATGDVSEEMFKFLVQGYAKDAGKLLLLKICHEGCATTWSQQTTDKWVKEIVFDQTGNLDTSINPNNGWSAKHMRTMEEIIRDRRPNESPQIEMEACFVGASSEATAGCKHIAVFDILESKQSDALLSIAKTFFVMAVLVAASISFSQDSQTLVIAPIERMMSMINNLANNPLGNSSQSNVPKLDDELEAQEYETAFLETTLQKVATLLQVGFGSAGGNIIAKNMQGAGELDPMIKGKKIISIYGFCDIRQFTDTTECLQEEVMVYVNKLGDIVHGCAHSFFGMANKNVGDAFLLSWKICDGKLPGFTRFEDSPDERARITANELFKCPANASSGYEAQMIQPTEMADFALHAFLKTLVDLENNNTNGSLTEYASHERVVKRFGTNFRIKMGFGMHVGWAIEGAIGSSYKIDATYLSPHVEMCDRLEAGSKIFGTPMNLSHWFVALLSPEARAFLRLMDCIKVAGCPVPMGVYTFDVSSPFPGFGKHRIDKQGYQEMVNFRDDPQYKQLQEDMNPNFVPMFTEGVQLYLRGMWPAAKQKLTEALNLKNRNQELFHANDGPTKRLLGIINTVNNGNAPDDWPGYYEMDGY